MFSCSQCCKIYSRSFCRCLTFVSGYFQKYKEPEKSVRVEEIDGVKLVKNLAMKMEEVFRKKAEATRVGTILNVFVKKTFYSVNVLMFGSFLLSLPSFLQFLTLLLMGDLMVL